MRLLLILCLIAGPGLAQTFCPHPINLVFSGDWYPYFYLDKQGQYSGRDLELLRKGLMRMDCELAILHLPERRISADLLSGRVDVAIAATLTEQRQKQFMFSIPYRLQTIVLVYRKSDRQTAALDTILDLVQQNKLVALNRGGWYGHEVAAVLDSKWARQLMHVETFASRLELLRRGRVDAFIDDKDTVLAEMQRNGLTDLALITRPLDIAEQHYMFSKIKLDEAFVTEFNRQLSIIMGERPPKSARFSPLHPLQSVPAH